MIGLDDKNNGCVLLVENMAQHSKIVTIDFGKHKMLAELTSSAIALCIVDKNGKTQDGSRCAFQITDLVPEMIAMAIVRDDICGKTARTYHNAVVAAAMWIDVVFEQVKLYAPAFASNLLIRRTRMAASACDIDQIKLCVDRGVKVAWRINDNNEYLNDREYYACDALIAGVANDRFDICDYFASIAPSDNCLATACTDALYQVDYMMSKEKYKRAAEWLLKHGAKVDDSIFTKFLGYDNSEALVELGVKPRIGDVEEIIADEAYYIVALLARHNPRELKKFMSYGRIDFVREAAKHFKSKHLIAFLAHHELSS